MKSALGTKLYSLSYDLRLTHKVQVQQLEIATDAKEVIELLQLKNNTQSQTFNINAGSCSTSKVTSQSGMNLESRTRWLTCYSQKRPKANKEPTFCGLPTLGVVCFES